MDTWEGPLPGPHSDARSLENMVMASGKLGGVAGVFLGVHICRKRREREGGFKIKAWRTCCKTSNALM